MTRFVYFFFYLKEFIIQKIYYICMDGCFPRSFYQHQLSTTTTTTTTTTPMPRTTTTVAVEETTVSTTMTPSHKQACLPEEAQSTNCLHGGTCYVVVLNDYRQSLCHCTEDWTGKRCEQYFIDPGILASMEENMRTANIAAGVSVCILVLFLLLLATYIYLRYKRRQILLLKIELHTHGEEKSYPPPYSEPTTGKHPRILSSERRESRASTDCEINICIDPPDQLQLLPPRSYAPLVDRIASKTAKLSMTTFSSDVISDELAIECDGVKWTL